MASEMLPSLAVSVMSSRACASKHPGSWVMMMMVTVMVMMMGMGTLLRSRTGCASYRPMSPGSHGERRLAYVRQQAAMHRLATHFTPLQGSRPGGA